MTRRKPVARWPLASREKELKTLAHAWAERQNQGVVIYGPAGVGKSRVAEEFLSWAAHEGWKTLRATASAAAAAVPLGAIAHLLPTGIDLTDPVKGFAVVATALAGPRRDRPPAVWVDDLHLLDPSSAVLLRQLLDARVIRLIATVRVGEPLNEAVAALTDPAALYRLDLPPFDEQQVKSVLESALGGPVGPYTRRELHDVSGGNALYLHELVVGTLRSGTLTNDGEIWEMGGDRPASTSRLTELIKDRLAAADPVAWPVLELLAVTEPLSLVDALQTAPPEVLEDLEEAGLIHVATGFRRTTVQLSHPLYGETVRGGLDDSRRRVMLLEQIDRVQAHGARRRDDALRIATWQLASTGTADPGLLLQAASVARHAHDYAQAIALLDAMPKEHRTPEVHLLHGHVLREAGRLERASELFSEVARKADEELQELAAIVGQVIILTISKADADEALKVVRTAREGTVSPEIGRQLDFLEGAILCYSGQPVEGLEKLAELPPDPQSATDMSIWMMCVSRKTSALSFVGRTEEAVAHARLAYDMHRELDEHLMIIHPAIQLPYLTMALCEAGLLAQARDVDENSFSDLPDNSEAINRITANRSFYRGRLEWLAGHAAEAHRYFTESLALFRKSDILLWQRLACSGLAASAAVLGHPAPAQAALDEAEHLPRVSYLAGEEELGRAWLLVARGDPDAAREVLRSAAEAARATHHVTSEMMLLTDIARLGGAREVTPRLAEVAALCDGGFAPARARFAEALASEDPDQLLAAATGLEKIGADLLAAEAANVAAAAWRSAGQSRRATAAALLSQVCAGRCQGARTPLLAAVQGAVELTRREREVALLAAAGSTSKDIAGHLHLSVRTVDNHIQRAYAKLGVTTRGELADVLGTARKHR